MPILALPEDARDSRSSGGGSGGREANRTADVSTELTNQELADHFAPQVQAQGWVLDSSWYGELASGTVWWSRPNGTTNLTGMLEVISMGDSNYRTSFRLFLTD